MKISTLCFRPIYILLLIVGSLVMPCISQAAGINQEISALSEQNITFIENKGQVRDENGKPLGEVFFIARSPGMTVCFTPNSVYYVSADYNMESSALELKNPSKPLKAKITGISRIDMHIFGSRPSCLPEGLEPASGIFNYYFSRMDEINNIRSFRKIIYRNIYNNIDLVFYNSPSGQGLKYDFIVRPGGRVSDIRLSYKGGAPGIMKAGSLTVKNSLASVNESVPYAYLEGKGNATAQSASKSEVKCRFVSDGKTISFSAGDYDRSKTLVIDPQVLWSTYYGGANADHANAISVDKDKNVIVAGMTLSDNLPATPGVFQEKRDSFFDLYITKFDASGKHIWTTYFGGNQSDYCSSVATDVDGSILVTGWTWSNAFPVTPGAYQTVFRGNENDGFIAKLDKNGQRLWATYYGGEKNEHAYGIAVDASGNLAITGWTLSDSLLSGGIGFQSSRKGMEDAFVARFTGSGAFLWGTYFGGDSTDSGQGIAIDPNGDIIIAGSTSSYNLPMKGNPVQLKLNRGSDMFIAKFDANGSLVFSTYLGGENHDYATSVTTDANSNIIVGGYTFSSSFPMAGDPFQSSLSGKKDGVLAKFTRTGGLVFSTYLGGKGDEDEINSVCVDADKNIIATGQTDSPDFPVTVGAMQAVPGGGMDAFVTKFMPDGKSLQWSSYLGGSKNDWGIGVDYDGQSSLYLCGDSESDNFITTAGAFSRKRFGLIDAFIVRLCTTAPRPVIKASGPLTICKGDSITLDAGAGYIWYQWSTGERTRKITVSDSGEYSVTVYDSNLCDGKSASVFVKNFPQPRPDITGQTEFCSGDTSTLSVNGNFVAYVWSNGLKTKSINVTKSGKYIVTVTDANGCTGRDTAIVTANPRPKPIISGPPSVCANSKDVVYYVYGTGGHTYDWSAEGGTLTYGTEKFTISVDWNSAGKGKVIVSETDDKTGCTGYDTLDVTISDNLSPHITSDKEKFDICQGDTLILDAGSGYYKYKWSDGSFGQRLSVTASGNYSVTVNDAGGCVGSDTVTVTVYPRPNPVISGDSVVCADTKGSIYSTENINGHIYKWTVKGGTIISGDSTSSIIVDWSDSATAEVSLEEIIESTGCSSIAKSVNVKIMPLPDLKLQYEGKLEFCEGDSVILDAGTGFASYLWSTGETSQIIIARKSGNYKITVMNSFGCKSQDSLYVLVFPKPPKPQISESHDSLVSDVTAYAYQWSKDGQPINGADKQFFVPTEEGSYSITVYNEHYCSSVSDPYDFKFRVAEADIALSDTIRASSGEEVLIPVFIERSQNLNRVGARNFIIYLRYNSTMLIPSDESLKVLPDGTDRIIILSGTRSDTVGKITEALFRAALGDMPCSPVTIDSVIWRESPVKTTVRNTVFCLNDLCQAGGTRLIDTKYKLEFLPVYPNPFSSTTRFEFELIESGYTRLYLMDPLGKEIVTVYETNKPGRHFVDFDGSALATGIYIAVLQTPTQKLIRKIEVVR